MIATTAIGIIQAYTIQTIDQKSISLLSVIVKILRINSINHQNHILTRYYHDNYGRFSNYVR